MKKRIFCALAIPLLFAVVSCTGEKEKEQVIQLSNTSEIQLTDKAVSIEREQFAPSDGAPNIPMLVRGADTLPSQINDLDGDGQWDALFVVTDFEPGETQKVTVHWVDSLPDFSKRTGARFGKRDAADVPVRPRTEETFEADELPKSLGYQPYQTDGPSWENDKVGFRHYLDGRNAKDLFGKKTEAISPDWVGLDSMNTVVDNYHVMEDWGRDVLSVGNSVGLGGYGLKLGDTLMRLGVTVDDSINNVARTHFRIAAEGPVNSILHYEYEDWKTHGRTYNVSETTSIWPGMYGYKNTVSVQGLQGDEELVVGLVNINTEKPLTEIEPNDEYVILYTHDRQTYESEWWLGMALIVPQKYYLGHTEAPESGDFSNTFLARLDVKEGTPISYFAVGTWELSDPKFVEETYFVDYLTTLANQLVTKIEVQFENRPQ
ncbi:MAG TPA: DUF4861 domain-containing protein [Pricia sp.]|nr:DUF4861 domain-containing protein [Pricia sp.]